MEEIRVRYEGEEEKRREGVCFLVFGFWFLVLPLLVVWG